MEPQYTVPLLDREGADRRPLNSTQTKALRYEQEGKHYQPDWRGLTARYLVSEDFRRDLLVKYPALSESVAYRRLTANILFGTWRCSVTGLPVVPAALLAWMEDKVPQRYRYLAEDGLAMPLFEGTAHNYDATAFLAAFSRDVVPLKINDYRFKAALARTVESAAFDDAILRRADEERSGVRVGVVVDLVTGARWCPREKSETLSAMRSQAEGLVSGREEMEELRLLLNGQHPRMFQAVVGDGLPKAREVVRTLERDRERQHAILSAIEACPVPMYKGTPRCARLHSHGASIASLCRPVREALLTQTTTLDLWCSQLAIVSVLWGVDSLRTWLQDGVDAFDEWASMLGVVPDKATRRVLKSFGYGAAYGGSEEGRLRQGIDDRFGPGAYEKIRASEQIVELFARRGERMTRLSRLGECEDAFGRTLVLEHVRRDGRYMPNVPSLLGLVAQSYEAKMMREIGLEILQHTDAKILVWLHDGLSIRTPGGWSDVTVAQRAARVFNAANTTGSPTQLQARPPHKDQETIGS